MLLGAPTRVINAAVRALVVVLLLARVAAPSAAFKGWVFEAIASRR
jgi:hypothetical protein